MTQEELLVFYDRLHSPEQRVQFLLTLAFKLTISARETYEFQSTNVVEPTRLRGINELQHRIVGQASRILGNGHLFPNDVLIIGLFEAAKAYGCMSDLDFASSSAAGRV